VGLYVSDGEQSTAKDISETCALYGLFLIAFVIPCLISIACLIIKAMYLRKPSVGGTENNNKKVTNTIMMMTIVFVVCNTINIVIISIAMWYPDWMGSETSSTLNAQESSEVPKPPRLTPENSAASNKAVPVASLTNSHTDDDVIAKFYRTIFAVQQVLPLLNSTLSPMILIWRGSALWNFIKNDLVKASAEAILLSSRSIFLD
jgi:hypothetical protein